MGKCSTFYDELRFDTRDPDVTHVYMFIRAEGDCPFWCYGWHHKAFPSSVTTPEIITKLWEGDDPVTWDREPPRPVNTPVLFNPWERVPVPVEQLVAWREDLAKGDGSMSDEYAEQISAHLSSTPEWHKACPYCRAHDMMLQAQRNPPQ